MNAFAQTKENPNQILFAFDEVVNPGTNLIRWAVAYTTTKGCMRLVDRVARRMGTRQWESSPKVFVTSLDFGLTEPNALRFLRDVPSSQVRIANASGIRSGTLNPAKAFHPKLYLFNSPTELGYVVGSANLTENALLHNTETVIAGREEPRNSAWEAVWRSLERETELISHDLLDRYESLWERPRPRLVEADPPVPVREITSAGRPVLWDEIVSGRINPTSFGHFWTEAGSMSSGGSHNQLELPRGGNVFFGFMHDHYGSAHETIGFPTVTLRGRSWRDRPLTWHGDNKMERMNLPTISQGGFEYRNTAILFRRHPGGFELEVLPWDDAGAIAWRNASDLRSAVFKLGARGSRICGLF